LLAQKEVCYSEIQWRTIGATSLALSYLFTRHERARDAVHDGDAFAQVGIDLSAEGDIKFTDAALKEDILKGGA
jgi:hypothetical protein